MTRLRRRLILAAWRLANEVHAPADAAARASGLTVTRYGITGRECRHPNFDTIRSSTCPTDSWPS